MTQSSYEADGLAAPARDRAARGGESFAARRARGEEPPTHCGT